MKVVLFHCNEHLKEAYQSDRPFIAEHDGEEVKYSKIFSHGDTKAMDTFREKFKNAVEIGVFDFSRLNVLCNPFGSPCADMD